MLNKHTTIRLATIHILTNCGFISTLGLQINTSYWESMFYPSNKPSISQVFEHAVIIGLHRARVLDMIYGFYITAVTTWSLWLVVDDISQDNTTGGNCLSCSPYHLCNNIVWVLQYDQPVSNLSQWEYLEIPFVDSYFLAFIKCWSLIDNEAVTLPWET